MTSNEIVDVVDLLRLMFESVLAETESSNPMMDGQTSMTSCNKSKYFLPSGKSNREMPPLIVVKIRDTAGAPGRWHLQYQDSGTMEKGDQPTM